MKNFTAILSRGLLWRATAIVKQLHFTIIRKIARSRLTAMMEEHSVSPALVAPFLELTEDHKLDQAKQLLLSGFAGNRPANSVIKMMLTYAEDFHCACLDIGLWKSFRKGTLNKALSTLLKVPERPSIKPHSVRAAFSIFMQ